MFVQFTDKTRKIVGSVFEEPQDEQLFPFQGEVEKDDPRYVAFITPFVVQTVSDPLEKLKEFLLANPDVAEILK